MAKKIKDSKANVIAEIKSPVTVDKIEVPGEGVRFSVSYSFNLPEGTNNFDQMIEVVDQEVHKAREETITLVAKHLGADVTFT